MTIIVGLERNDEVFMGCDSAGTGYNYAQCTVRDPKVFENEGLLMGMCGSFRLGQLLQHALAVPDRDPRKENDMEWLVTDYVDAVREMLQEKGHIHKGEHTEETMPGSDYLLGYRGKLYIVEENFQILKVNEDYLATGCGYELAAGALYTMKQSPQWNETDPVDIITNAIRAACHHNAGCALPLHIFKLDKEGKITKIK